MDQGSWITIILLAFGSTLSITVAAIYIQMFCKGKRAITAGLPEDVSPSTPVNTDNSANIASRNIAEVNPNSQKE